ncbi:uncharacterized protein YALI1_A16031g [Yarrowia lipolytica]|uniref:Uncharacterized protein n=1 Tax=Yarrowia lipolytica TaxID=4952 RepID=A0A1D8N510_YARLL|nr:hypothetical protein YALI1_A16031g [Yarrowia lipolytica]
MQYIASMYCMYCKEELRGCGYKYRVTPNWVKISMSEKSGHREHRRVETCGNLWKLVAQGGDYDEGNTHRCLVSGC